MIKKIKDKLLTNNLYSIFLKMLGIGFQVVGLVALFKYYRSNKFVPGLCIFLGILILGVGEIINLLQQILDSKKIEDTKDKKKK